MATTVVSAPASFHMQPHLAAAVLTQLHHAPVVHSSPHPSQAAAMQQPNIARQPKSEPEFTVEDIQKYFNIPAKQAAKKLNIGITKLKLVCRQLGVRRWPYRTLRAAAKKPLSKLAARVRKEGILKMVELNKGKRGVGSPSFSGSSSGDEAISASGTGSDGSAFNRVPQIQQAVAQTVPMMLAPGMGPMQLHAVPVMAHPAGGYMYPHQPMAMMSAPMPPLPSGPSTAGLNDAQFAYLIQRFQEFGRVVYSPVGRSMAIQHQQQQSMHQ